MESEWRDCQLGDFVRLQRGHDLTALDRTEGRYPVMGSAGQNGTHVEYKAQGPGVVIGRSGASAGRVHFCPVDYWPHNTCLYVTDFLGNDPRFAYYYLDTLSLADYNSGSAQPSLNRNFIYTKSVSVPPPETQREIAALLGGIDDRIDVLRQTNTTLEAIAQALFKSWFVDFDPVHAKAEGREPEGMDASTAALFPDEFEESELGLVPKGWSVRSIDSFASYLNGLALQKYPPEGPDEYLPVIKIAQLRAGHASSADRASAQLKREYVVHDGDVLFSWSGSLEVEFWCGGDGALNQHLFKITSDVVPKWYYYLATRHFLTSFRETAAHKATTMGHIQRKHLTEAKLALPPSELLDALKPLIGSLLERRVSGALQARELTAIRDTLLPRLISGKLRLNETSHELTL